MGKAIEAFANDMGHEIGLIVNRSNRSTLSSKDFENIDVAIEFSTPETALENIQMCFENNVPVVVGTTGWLDQYEDLKSKHGDSKGLFFASNFSIGMNIVFEMNKKLAKIMNDQKGYDLIIDEWHHIHKLDAPSGTAITLAEGIIENSSKNAWELDGTSDSNVNIKAYREGEIPGTHLVTYNSPIDAIEIKHTAHNRDGFAKGAVVAAEFLNGKTGFYGMSDLLNI